MKKYLIAFLIISGIILPAISFAGLPDFNGPFVICGRSGTGEGSAPCTLCDIFKTAQLIIDTIIGFLGLIAVPFLIAVGGFMILLHGASPELVTKGKTVIKNAIIGFIIALLAWTIINMIFLALAGGDNGVGKIFNAPWNEINCTGGEVNEDDEGNITAEKYCVCETPVYDLNPSSDSTAEIIGNNAKVYSGFTTVEECTEKCVKENASTYCHSSLKMDAANLYCSDEAGLESKKACTLTVSSSTPCQVGNCTTSVYNSLNECYNGARTNFKKICYLDGSIMCECVTAAQMGVCDHSSSKYVLRQILREQTYSSGVDGIGTDLSNCGGYDNVYCRLNCQYQKCRGGSTTTSCTGVTCSDANLDICGSIYANCSLTNVAKWNSQIDAASKNRTICSLITTTRMVKAIMSQESGGKINSISGAGAGGLMQLLPATANQYKGNCGVTDNITLDWLTNKDNAEKQICIAIEYMKSLVGSCGCSVSNIAAGYNGGGGRLGACSQSTNCGPEAATDNGECLACSNQEFTRRWQCLWDDNKHTKCNVDNSNGSFNETRKYAPKVNYCYDQFR